MTYEDAIVLYPGMTVVPSGGLFAGKPCKIVSLEKNRNCDRIMIMVTLPDGFSGFYSNDDVELT